MSKGDKQRSNKEKKKPKQNKVKPADAARSPFEKSTATPGGKKGG